MAVDGGISRCQEWQNVQTRSANGMAQGLDGMAEQDGRPEDLRWQENPDREAKTRKPRNRYRPKRKRKDPTLREKCAAALLTICRPDENGILKPVVDREAAKTMTHDQIISCFQFDHLALHAFGGSNHPANLDPKPTKEHRTKSANDTKIVAKNDRLEPAHIKFQQRMLAKVGQAEPDEDHDADNHKKNGSKLKGRGFQTGKKVKIKSAGFRGARKFNGNVNWKEQK